MKSLLVLLAEVDANDLFDAQKQLAGSRLYEILAMAGGLVLAIGIGTAWAIRFSKKKKKHSHRHGKRSNTDRRALDFSAVTDGKMEENPQHRRVRRQRRPHRPINPTLAQTRGLPPIRDENTPLPPMP